jgi:hypothetical protein
MTAPREALSVLDPVNLMTQLSPDDPRMQEVHERMRELTIALKDNTDSTNALKVEMAQTQGALRVSIAELVGRVVAIELSLATVRTVLASVVGGVLVYVIGHALHLTH